MNKQCPDCHRFMKVIRTRQAEAHICLSCTPKLCEPFPPDDGVLSVGHVNVLDQMLDHSRTYTPPDGEEER